MDSPSLDADEDLAFRDGGLGLLKDLDCFESAEAGENDGAHLLGRRGLLLLVLDGLLGLLLGRGVGGAILGGGGDLLGRGGRGRLCALRHV